MGFVTERGEGAVVLRIAEVPVAIKLSCETARDAVFRRFEYLQFPWDDRAGEALTPSLRFEEGSVSAVSPAGRADLELGSGVIRGTDDVVLIDALTRVAVAWHLAERDGVLLHASAWLEEGLAQVGFGHSGVGKSTLARSAKRALADELVAIVSRPPGFEVHGTPWWVGCEAAAPLGDLIWLLRGEEPSTRCVRGGSLVPALWEQVRRDDPDPHHLRRIAESCARLAARGAIRVAASEGQVVEAVRNRAAASSRGVGLHALSRARSA